MDLAAGHRSVLRDEVVRLLAPAGRRVILDCTVGTGSHAEAMLLAAGGTARLIGVDVDGENLRLARERLASFGTRVRLFQANFSEVEAVLETAEVAEADVILADLGVASTQLDDPRRGLSFLMDGPLDMRLDPRLDRTAADLVNRLGEEELADLIHAYGEERYSRRIAKAIVAARKRKPLQRTLELSRVAAAAVPAPARRTRRGVHPATRTFQALRIAVNDEMENLEKMLKALPGILAVGGRAGIISFHSLEDRRVKHAFAGWAQTGSAKLLTKKPIVPTAEEMAENPRSRSAKLRGVQRVAQVVSSRTCLDGAKS